MSNSSLVSYTRISPNKNSPRTHSIYIITPHCVVGQVSVERLGEIFASPSKDASSNYGIGYDGRVGMYVEEKDRSWCSSSAWNDNRAVTIECASDTYDPYRINDVVYERLIDLMTDICKRNGKSKLLWFNSREKTLNYSPAPDEMIITVHRWFDTKACPGNYIFNRLGAIANEVTKRLQDKPEPIMDYTRIWGYDRYNTSKGTINVLKNANTGVTIVNGENFADALSATYFAKEKNAPILLASNAVIDDTVKYIKERANIQKVYIIGGYGVLSEEFETKLDGYPIERYMGTTRYDTNLAVLKACKTPNAQLLIANGQNFPDGLCAGMIDRPLMLVNKSLKKRDIDFIKERGFKTFYIFGGTGVVSQDIEDELKRYGEVSRFAGSNRYETSRIIAEKFYPNATKVIYASGQQFPDGLSASNLGRFPLILVDNGFTYEARKYITNANIKSATAVGGTGVLSDTTMAWALTKLG